MAENKLKGRDILLVEDSKSGRVRAVAGMSEDGNKIKTVAPSMRNGQRFLTVEENSSDLGNFFKGFMSRTENPSDTKFYRMSTNGLEQGVTILEGLLNHQPDAPFVTGSRVRPEDYVNPAQAEDAKVLLTKGEDGKMKAIVGAGADGRPKTVDPTDENADSFLKIDTRGNALENFFKKFSEQFNHPSHTGIYAVSAKIAGKIAPFLEKIVGLDPQDKVLDPYRVTAEGKMPQQAGGKYQPFDLNRLDWNEVEKLGLLGGDLRDALKAMAYGHKSPGLVDIKTHIDGQELSTKARLSLVEQPDGSIRIQTHPWQEKPDFDRPFMGVGFTKDDIEQFRQTGNGGRVFDLEQTPGGEKIPSLVSLDRITNRFEAVPLSAIQIPQKLKGVELSDAQQEGLKAGRGVLVENMDKKVKSGEEPGAKITRIVQYNAADKKFDFIFTPEQKEQRRQERADRTEQKAGPDDNALKVRKVGDVWIRPVQGGVELTPEQFKALCDDKPVYVEGMQRQQPKQEQGAQQTEATDRKGQKYNAWVWPDQDAGRVRHTSLPPDQWKAVQAKKQAQPAEGFKTQAAVNNDGKTHEATRHAQANGEPLKKGQTQPTGRQAEQKERHQRQYQTPRAPRKSTGHKM